MEEFQQISDQLSPARETMSRVRYLECRLNGNNEGETSLVMIGNQAFDYRKVTHNVNYDKIEGLRAL